MVTGEAERSREKEKLEQEFAEQLVTLKKQFQNVEILQDRADTKSVASYHCLVLIEADAGARQID